MAPPWAQLRQDGTADAIARSATFSSRLITDLYLNALGRNPSSGELNNLSCPALSALRRWSHLLPASSTARAANPRDRSWYQLYLNRARGSEWGQCLSRRPCLRNESRLGPDGLCGLAGGFHRRRQHKFRVCRLLVRKILGRTPSQSEMSGWVSQLNAGSLTRAQVASAFFNSDEYTNRLIDAYYAAYQPGGLSTPPPDDLEAMAMDLRSGHTEQQVLTQLLTANGDYVSMQPQGSWVRALYQDVLGRAGGPSEVASWLTVLANGTSMTAVAYSFVSSPEANAQLVSTPQYPAGSARIGDIQGYYEHFLGRTPSAAEAAIWENALDSGESRTSVILAFLGSDEYYNLTGGTPTGFVDKVFNDLYGRPPTAANLQQVLSLPNLRSALPGQALLERRTSISWTK